MTQVSESVALPLPLLSCKLGVISFKKNNKPYTLKVETIEWKLITGVGLQLKKKCTNKLRHWLYIS